MVEFRAMCVTCFESVFEFSTPTGSTSQLRVQMTALNKKQAVIDSIRFWEGRHKAVPEYFHEILAVQVFTKTIGPIDGKGMATGKNGPQFFEWKTDWPVNLKEYAKEFENKQI